jgi:hypothetical protein
METTEQADNDAATTSTDVPVDDESIVDPESLLDVEFDEDEDESDIIMNDDGQEGIELQRSE